MALPDFYDESKNKVRFRLLGFENNFSKFSQNHHTSYTNLFPGKYKFQVQGLNALGEESLLDSYDFIIKPPWWRSTTFYICEFLFISIFLVITLLLKYARKSTALSTAFSFMIILAVFEYIDIFLEPYLLFLTGGVPVLGIASKVILGLLLMPVERYMDKIFDKIATLFGNLFQTKANKN